MLLAWLSLPQVWGLCATRDQFASPPSRLLEQGFLCSPFFRVSRPLVAPQSRRPNFQAACCREQRSFPKTCPLPIPAETKGEGLELGEPVLPHPVIPCAPTLRFLCTLRFLLGQLRWQEMQDREASRKGSSGFSGALDAGQGPGWD